MPRWTRWYLRAAFCWLLLGFSVGSVLLAARGTGWNVPWPPLLGMHQDALLVGWLLQFTLGVAWWMLPRHATGPERGPEAPVAAAWVLLNLGLSLVMGGGWLGAAALLVTAGRILELAAVLAFGWNIVPRIKPFGAGRERTKPEP